MYKNLRIKNFRGLRELNLPNLAPITILTGRNNVGKTAVLEALFLHAGGPRAALLLVTALRPYRQNGPTSIEISRYSTPWEMAFFDRDSSNAIKLTGLVDNQMIDVELSIPSGGPSVQASKQLPPNLSTSSVTSATVPGFTYEMDIAVTISHDPAGELERREYVQTITAQFGVAAIAAPSVGQQFGSMNFNLSPADNSDALVLSYFISPQNYASSTELAQRYTNIRLREREGRYLDAMRVIEPSIDSIEILVSGGQPTLFFKLRGGPLLSVASVGDGMAAVANYAAVIFETDRSVVLIDEIENGIHYSVLEKLWRQIGLAVRETGNQVVVSTHSYECLRAASRAFRDDPGMLQMIRLEAEDQFPAATVAVEYDSEALEDAIKMGLDVR